MAGWEVLRSDGDVRSPRPGLRRWAILEVAGGGAALIVSHILLARGVDPVASWFYAFAWWPTIILLDGVNFLTARDSLILTRRRTFLLLLPLSVTIWLVFEAFNLRMQDWAYVLVPRSLPVRWAGMTVAFATVLPAIFEIADLLQALGLPRAVRVRPLKVGPALLLVFHLVGIAFLAAPILLPRYAFPLVWGGFVFLLDPWCYRRGLPSLIRRWEGGSLLTFVRLLIAGFVAGGLWEVYNFWARTKWVYTVPFFEEWKVFEMPVLGFLGFPPFAVECFVMATVASLVAGPIRRWPSRLLLAALILGFWAASFWGIARMTVVSYAPGLSDLGGVESHLEDRWIRSGIGDLHAFRRGVAAEGAPAIAGALGVTEPEVKGWAEEAALMLHAGMGAENARVLMAHGIGSVEEIRSVDAAEMHRWLRSAPGRDLPPPRLAVIRIWIRLAP